jgi:hypothetical protein
MASGFLRRLMLAASASLFLAAPARADWEYTKWGMTVDEVLAASSEKLYRTDKKFQEETRVVVTDDNVAALVAGVHTSGRYTFFALLYFDVQSKRLVTVSLKLTDIDSAGDLKRDLQGQYGPPTEGQGSHSQIWTRDGNRIIYFRDGTLKYSPE